MVICIVVLSWIAFAPIGARIGARQKLPDCTKNLHHETHRTITATGSIPVTAFPRIGARALGLGLGTCVQLGMFLVFSIQLWRFGRLMVKHGLHR